jgi:hypothetical protein
MVIAAGAGFKVGCESRRESAKPPLALVIHDDWS